MATMVSAVENMGVRSRSVRLQPEASPLLPHRDDHGLQRTRRRCSRTTSPGSSATVRCTRRRSYGLSGPISCGAPVASPSPRGTAPSAAARVLALRKSRQSTTRRCRPSSSRRNAVLTTCCSASSASPLRRSRSRRPRPTVRRGCRPACRSPRRRAARPIACDRLPTNSFDTVVQSAMHWFRSLRGLLGLAAARTLHAPLGRRPHASAAPAARSGSW